MCKPVIIAAAAVAAALAAGSASAAQFSWYGLGSLSVTGDFQQTAPISCNDTYAVALTNVGGAGEAQVGTGGQAITWGDTLCPNVTFYSDWSVSTGAYDAVTDTVPLTVSGITVATLIGTCAGNVGGTWHNNGAAAGEAVIIGAIPGVVFSFSVPCQMAVAATVSPDVTMF